MANNNQIQTGSSVLSLSQGGTGLSSITANNLLYSSANNTLSGLSTANNGVLSTNGSGIPSIVTSLSNTVYQVAINTTWTPTDASGASLSLTVSKAVYSQLGNLIVFSMTVIYPSTANSSQAIIGGLPFNAKEKNYYYIMPSSTINGSSGCFQSAGGSTLTMINRNTNASITNTNCSTKTINISGFYIQQ